MGYIPLLLVLLFINCQVLVQGDYVFTENDIETILDLHNMIRNQSDANKLTWDDKCVANAAISANQQVCGSLEHHNAHGFGENLAYDTRSPDIETIKILVQRWIDEGPEGLHFSQVTWKDTRTVGCAIVNKGDCNSMMSCQYFPAGNMGGSGLKGFAGGGGASNLKGFSGDGGVSSRRGSSGSGNGIGNNVDSQRAGGRQSAVSNGKPPDSNNGNENNNNSQVGSGQSVESNQRPSGSNNGNKNNNNSNQGERQVVIPNLTVTPQPDRESASQDHQSSALKAGIAQSAVGGTPKKATPNASDSPSLQDSSSSTSSETSNRSPSSPGPTVGVPRLPPVTGVAQDTAHLPTGSLNTKPSAPQKAPNRVNNQNSQNSSLATPLSESGRLSRIMLGSLPATPASNEQTNKVLRGIQETSQSAEGSRNAGKSASSVPTVLAAGSGRTGRVLSGTDQASQHASGLGHTDSQGTILPVEQNAVKRGSHSLSNPRINTQGTNNEPNRHPMTFIPGVGKAKIDQNAIKKPAGSLQVKQETANSGGNIQPHAPSASNEQTSKVLRDIQETSQDADGSRNADKPPSSAPTTSGAGSGQANQVTGGSGSGSSSSNLLNTNDNQGQPSALGGPLLNSLDTDKSGSSDQPDVNNQIDAILSGGLEDDAKTGNLQQPALPGGSEQNGDVSGVQQTSQDADGSRNADKPSSSAPTTSAAGSEQADPVLSGTNQVGPPPAGERAVEIGSGDDSSSQGSNPALASFASDNSQQNDSGSTATDSATQ